MAHQIEALPPLERTGNRKTAVDVYEALQKSILLGKLKPGTILSQVEVARAYDVSRTPVREAMRMLQEGGLLTGEPNYRCRVVGFDPVDIEALYMKRIAMEAMAVSLTTSLMTPALAEQLSDTVQQLESEKAHSDFESWRTLHRKFHHLIVSLGGTTLVDELGNLELLSARYQSASKGAHLPGWWQRGEAEHRALYDAISARNVAKSGELAARHLARTALELLAALAPEHDSSRLRASLKYAIAGSGGLA